MTSPINPPPLWTTLSAYFASALDSLAQFFAYIFASPPRYRAPLRFGFLQGTFGLPYGGHLVQPEALPDTIALTPSMPMFACLGSARQIHGFLVQQTRTSLCTVNVPCGSGGLVVEMYRDRSYDRLAGWWDMGQRQVVVRAQRAFSVSEFRPLLRVTVPQGVLLSEVAEVLERCRCGDHDLTRDKRLNLGIVARARAVPVPDLDDAQLPPYERRNLPPPYEH